MTSLDNDPLPHSHTPGSARAALSYRSYRIIWTGLLLSSIGTWMQNLALPAYIDHRTGSARIVGILIFAQLGPLLLLAIPGSVLADRVNRRFFLLAMQWLQLVFSLVLAAIVASDGPIWAIFLAQLVIGTGNALNAPAFQASIPLLVDRRDLAGAISMNSIQLNGSRVLGPTLAAVLLTVSICLVSLSTPMSYEERSSFWCLTAERRNAKSPTRDDALDGDEGREDDVEGESASPRRILLNSEDKAETRSLSPCSALAPRAEERSERRRAR